MCPAEPKVKGIQENRNASKMGESFLGVRKKSINIKTMKHVQSGKWGLPNLDKIPVILNFLSIHI
jgi:hypothetical protein